MANVRNVKLSLDHNKRQNNVKVSISYKVGLSKLESNMERLRFRETIKLWGDDEPDADDHLHTFPTRYFYVDVAPDRSITRNLEATLKEDILDEDWFPWPTDEIYATVEIRPILPSSGKGKSNVAYGEF